MRSDVPLHAPTDADDGGGAELTIASGPAGPVTGEKPAGAIVAELTVDGARFYTGVRQGGTYLLRAHGLCDFEIDVGAGSIECRPDPAADQRFIPILLGGTVSAFYLGVAGRNVLHGSAVEVGGRGVAFIGHSSAGKSTVAAMMCAAGARLLTDDVLHLAVTGGVRCLGRATELRLRPASLPVLDGMDPPPPTRASADGKVAVAFAASPAGIVNLSQLIIPAPSRGSRSVDVRPLRGAEAAMALLRCPRLLGWVDPKVLAGQFTFVTALVREVPVYRASIPWGPPFSPAMARDLLDHLDAKQAELT